MTFGKNTVIRPSRDPGQAFRLLRRLHLAAALWGQHRALPIALLKETDRTQQFRILRVLLELEREGAVELHRVARAVRLADEQMRLVPAATGV